MATPEDQLKPQEPQEMTLRQYIDAYGEKIGVPKPLRDSIFEQESNWNHYDGNGRVKTSPKGARGVGQLMPATARNLGVNPDDPIQNAYGSLKLQKQLYDKYLEANGDPHEAALLTAAAYNAGEGAVEKYNGIPKYKETQNYVSKVAQRLKREPITQQSSVAASTPQQPFEQTTPTVSPDVSSTVSPTGLQTDEPRYVVNPQPITPERAPSQPGQAFYGLQSGEMQPPDDARYTPPKPPAGAVPASEFTSRETYDVPLKPFDVERVGALGMIGNAGSEAQQSYLDFVRRNAQPVKGKPVSVEDAAGNEALARTYVALQDYLQNNPKAKPKEQAKAIADLGMTWLKDPETEGMQLPKLLHQAMLEAHWTPDEFQALPSSLRSQIQQRMAQGAAVRHSQAVNRDALNKAKQEMVAQTFQDMQSAEPETAAKELVKAQNATPAQVREYWRNRGQLSAQSLGRQSTTQIGAPSVLPSEIKAIQETAQRQLRPQTGEIRPASFASKVSLALQEAMDKYAPGLAATNTKEGIHTNVISSFVKDATFGLLKLPAYVPANDREKVETDLADHVGSLLGAIIPYVGAAKAVKFAGEASKVAKFLNAVRETGTIGKLAVRAAPTATVFAGVGAAKEGAKAVRGESKGLADAAKNVGVDAVVGSATGLLAGDDPNIIRHIFSFVAPQVALAKATGESQSPVKITGKPAIDTAIFASILGLATYNGEVVKPLARDIIESKLSPEPIRNVVADVAKFGKNIVKSEDGRAVSLYADKASGQIFGNEIDSKTVAKYVPERRGQTLSAQDYDTMMAQLGIETNARPTALPEEPIQGEVVPPKEAENASPISSNQRQPIEAEAGNERQGTEGARSGDIYREGTPGNEVKPSEVVAQRQSGAGDVVSERPEGQVAVQGEGVAPLAVKEGARSPATEDQVRLAQSPSGPETHPTVRRFLASDFKDKILKAIGADAEPLNPTELGGIKASSVSFRKSDGSIVTIEDSAFSDSKPTYGSKRDGFVVSTQNPEVEATGVQRGQLPAAEREPLARQEPWQMTQAEFDRERPPVAGYRFHGSPEGDIGEIDPTMHSKNWREGIGFYTTESIEKARSYGQGRTVKAERRAGAAEKGRVNYVEGEPKKPLDMDASVDANLWQAVAKQIGEEIDPQDVYSSNGEAYRDLISRYNENNFTGEGQYAVEEVLGGMGFDATTHYEGKGEHRHRVTIYKGDIGTFEGKPFNTVAAKVVSPAEVHRRAVEQALQEGKSIPAEVLKDYPELAKKYPAPSLPSSEAKPAQSPKEIIESQGYKYIGEQQRPKGEPSFYMFNDGRHTLSVEADELTPKGISAKVEQSREARAAAEKPDVAQGLQSPDQKPEVASEKPNEKTVPTQKPQQNAPDQSSAITTGVQRVPIDQLNLDPERFQYKIQKTAKGTTGSLADVSQWNPNFAGVTAVWRDPADGRDYIVNGHNRFDLAKRTGQTDLDVRYIDAPNADAARAQGALMNIAEGQGSALDAGEFLRGHTPEDLKQQGVNLKRDLVAKGVALSKLNKFLFNQVVQGELPEDYAVQIGNKIENPDLQEQAFKAIKTAEAKGRALNKGTVDEMIDAITAAPRQVETEQTLFGGVTSERSLVVERAQVASALKRQLTADKSLFGTAARQSERLKEGGTVVDVAQAKQLQESAAEASGIFDMLKNRSGEISDILDEGARQVASGKRPDQVAKESYAKIKEAVSRLLGRGKARTGKADEKPLLGAEEPKGQRSMAEGAGEAESGVEPKVLAHVAGPSGAGKTELVNKLSESVKNIDLVDLDIFDEQAVSALGWDGKPKDDYTDEMLDQVHAKRQELIDAYIEKSDKPIVFFGHHIEGENVTDLPTEDRYLLNVSPTKAALNASRRPGKTAAQVKEDIAIGKKDVSDLKALDYEPLSSRAIYTKIKQLSEDVTRGRQTEAIQNLSSTESPGNAPANVGAPVNAVVHGERSNIRQGSEEPARTGQPDTGTERVKAESRPTDVTQASPEFQDWWEKQGPRGRDAIRAFLETGSKGKALQAWKEAASGVTMGDKQIKGIVNNLVDEANSRLSREAGAVAFGDVYAATSNLIQRARDQMTIEPIPGLKRIGVANEARQHAAARVAVPHVVRDFLSRVFPDQYTDPEAMAATIDIINKDNILGGYDTFLQRAREASAAQDEGMAQYWQNRADDVGDAQDVAQLQQDVEAARNDPQIAANIERWNQIVNPELDKLYNEMKRMDADTPREGRGRVFGARVNLLPESHAAEIRGFGDLNRPIPEGVSSNYRNPNVKKDRFMRQAKFTGQYSTDAEAVLTNVIGPRWNEVTKLRFYDALTGAGAAVELDYGETPPAEIQGHKAIRMPIKVPETGEGGITRMVEKVLYVRSDVQREARDVLNTDMPLPTNRLAKMLTTIQLAQLTDMTAHLKNIHTVLAAAPATRSAWLDAARRLPVIGTVDTVARIVNVTRDVMRDTPEIRAEQASMAKLGLIRPEYPATGLQKITRGQQLIHHVDTASRIVMNRFFDDLVDAGRVKDTPENRASFVQQIGEYNRRLMGPLMRAARDSGFAPFIVAGRNFNRQARRMLTGNPGVEASSLGESAKMRMVNILAGLVAATVLPSLLNLLTTGNFMGRPGTPIGAWDLGRPEDERGQHRIIDLMQIVGIRRGLRATGTGAVIEGLREGQTWDEITGKAVSDVLTTAAHPWMGPAPGFIYQTITGKRMDLRGGPEAPQAYNVGGGGKQYLENARTALENQNPLLYGVLSPLIEPVESEDSYLKTLGKGFVKGPTSAFGIYDMQSPAQKILSEDRRRRGAFSRTASQDVARELKTNLREKERKGENIEPDLAQAVTEGKLTLRQVNDFHANADLSALAVQMKYAPLNEATIRAFEAMDDRQKSESRVVVALKLQNANPEFFTSEMRARLVKDGFTIPDKIGPKRKESPARRERQQERKERKAVNRFLPPEARPTPNPNRRYQVTPR